MQGREEGKIYPVFQEENQRFHCESIWMSRAAKVEEEFGGNPSVPMATARAWSWEGSGFGLTGMQTS